MKDEHKYKVLMNALYKAYYAYPATCNVYRIHW